jgi:hypothetical protein
MLPIGLNKISQVGVTIGRVTYYQQSVQFMFLVLAAFAISSRWSGRRARPALGTLRPAASGWPALTMRRPSRLALAAGGIAAAAVYATLYATSVRALAHQVWQEGKDSAYVREYLTSDRQVKAAIGNEPVLIDLDVPSSCRGVSGRSRHTGCSSRCSTRSYALMKSQTRCMCSIRAAGLCRCGSLPRHADCSVRQASPQPTGQLGWRLRRVTDRARAYLPVAPRRGYKYPWRAHND